MPENKEKKDLVKKACQRTFQALRIDVNTFESDRILSSFQKEQSSLALCCIW